MKELALGKSGLAGDSNVNFSALAALPALQILRLNVSCGKLLHRYAESRLL